MSLLRRLLHVFVDEGEAYRYDTLVWDTSALSHAFESFSHGAVSAYMAIKNPPKTWERLKASFLRRMKSEDLSKRLLLSCDEKMCLISDGVHREVRRVPQFNDSIDVLIGLAKRVENKYVKMRNEKTLVEKGDPKGFARAFRARLYTRSPRPYLVERVLDKARELGLKISREDAEGVALAIETGGILVTGDKKQAQVANSFGVKVLYTLSKK